MPKATELELPEIKEVPASIKGKKKYDIFKGKWQPSDWDEDDNNRRRVTEWRFEPDGKAIKTGVPCEAHVAEGFNDSHCLRHSGSFCEIMIEVDSKDPILDRVRRNAHQ